MKKYQIETNLHVYNLILQTCANCRDDKSGLDILTRMSKDKLRPDQSTFSSLMTMFEIPKHVYSFNFFFFISYNFFHLKIYIYIYIYFIIKKKKTIENNNDNNDEDEDEDEEDEDEGNDKSQSIINKEDRNSKDFQLDQVLGFWNQMENMGLTPGNSS